MWHLFDKRNAQSYRSTLKKKLIKARSWNSNVTDFTLELVFEGFGSDIRRSYFHIELLMTITHSWDYAHARARARDGRPSSRPFSAFELGRRREPESETIGAPISHIPTHFHLSTSNGLDVLATDPAAPPRRPIADSISRRDRYERSDRRVSRHV